MCSNLKLSQAVTTYQKFFCKSAPPHLYALHMHIRFTQELNQSQNKPPKNSSNKVAMTQIGVSEIFSNTCIH